jgi:hypothetical protein
MPENDFNNNLKGVFIYCLAIACGITATRMNDIQNNGQEIECGMQMRERR